MLFLVFGFCAVFAAAVLAYALLRRQQGAVSRIEHDLEVYRAQLKELERERDSGLISETEAAAAKLEIERRVLAADQAGSAGAAKESRRREWVPAAMVAGLVPLAAVGIYAAIGNPEVPSVPFSEQSARRAEMAQAQRQAAQDDLPDVETMMARVRERLAQDPDDLQGWLVLARSALAMGGFDEAIGAYDQAIRLSGETVDLLSGKAEAMILAAQGRVSVEARSALDHAADLEPANARVRYYLAIAKQQDGDLQGAMDDFVAMLQSAPPDAPWAGVVRERTAALASDLGLDPSRVVPDAPLAAAGSGAAAAASPRAAVEELTARLDANPKDFRGWISLATALVEFGDREGARQALDRGAQVYEGAPFVLQQFDQAALDLGLREPPGGAAPRGPSQDDMAAAQSMTPSEQQDMIRGMVEGLAARLQDEPDDLRGWQMLARSYGVLEEPDKAARAYDRVLALAPNDPDALFFLGEAALKDGDKAQAETYWTKLLTQLAPGSAEHSMVRQRLEGLKAIN